MGIYKGDKMFEESIKRQLVSILILVLVIIILIFGVEEVEEVTEIPVGATEEIQKDIVVKMSTSLQSLMGEFGASLLAGEAANVNSLEEDEIEEIYGLTPDMYQQLEVRYPVDPADCDEYMFIHAAEGQIDNIVDTLKRRQAYLADEANAFSPEHKTYAEQYQLYARGEYVGFAIGINASRAIEFFKTKFV